jgi:cell cycle checkpoint control protein RAD9A
MDQPNPVPAVLKKPLHTSIAVETAEFDDIQVPQKLHIIVSVKDFRNILHHAQLTSGELAASYSNPGRPMKLSYRGDGLLCEYILMTVGEKDAAAGPRGTKRARAAANEAKSAAAPRQELEAAASTSSNRASSAGAPAGSSRPQQHQQPSVAAQQKTPARPRQSQFQIRPPPLPPPSTLRSESLFVAQDEDQQWEPVNADEDADGEEIARLEWDNHHVSFVSMACVVVKLLTLDAESVAETDY